MRSLSMLSTFPAALDFLPVHLLEWGVSEGWIEGEVGSTLS